MFSHMLQRIFCTLKGLPRGVITMYFFWLPRDRWPHNQLKPVLSCFQREPKPKFKPWMHRLQAALGNQPSTALSPRTKGPAQDQNLQARAL